MTPDPFWRAVSLNVSFDVDQSGNQLCWNFMDDQSKRNIFQTTGPYAGSVHFLPSERVNLQVSVFARNDDRYAGLHSVDIQSASVTSIPRRSGDRDRPFAPSPFQKEKTTSVFTVSGLPACTYPTTTRISYSWRSNEWFEVIQEKGLWELAMTLTTRFQRRDAYGDPFGPLETRVFTFDPEAEVGMGT
jgi:hypothetical protein